MSDYLATHCGKFPAIFITVMGLGLITTSATAKIFLKKPTPAQNIQMEQEKVIDNHQNIHWVTLGVGIVLVLIIWAPYLKRLVQGQKGASSTPGNQIAGGNASMGSDEM